MNQHKASESTGVIVLGPYRSGTSLTCLVLSRLGVDFGPARDMYAANRHNPGGYFERADVNKANTAFIESAGRTLAEPGDPFDLAHSGHASVLSTIDLSWTQDRPQWGIKDPRLTATLPAWFEHGLLSTNGVCFIHVTRRIESTVKSALKHPRVRDYGDGTESGMRLMIEKYAALTRDLVDHYSDIPTHEFAYESLIADPRQAVESLAAFLEISDSRTIHRAVQTVGKKRARYRHALNFVMSIGPAKIWRRILRSS